MKKKVILGVIVLIIVILIGMCFRTSEAKNGNISNLGLAVKDNSTVYYNKYEKGIFAVKNGKDEQLTDETAYSINIVGDKIYYITIADFNSVLIKCVDTNGENLRNIATLYTSISKIYVHDNYIYYATNNLGKRNCKN